jgi:hypothetical protein
LKVLGLWILALLAFVSGIAAEWQTERFQQSMPVEKVTQVSIENYWGDVRIRHNVNAEITLIAIVQQEKQTAVAYKLEITESDGALSIKPVFGDLAADAKENKKHRVDLSFLIPAKIPLAVTTERHLIEAKGMKQPLKLKSHSGLISFKTDAWVDIETFQGDIKGQLTAQQPNAPSKLVSTHGLISVWIPIEAGYSATLETERLISSDFSIDIAFLNYAMKQGTAVTGEGTQPLTIKSRRGDVRLLRLPGQPQTSNKL